jgi:hypothetical protein
MRLCLAALALVFGAAGCETSPDPMPPPPASISDPDVSPEPDVYTTPMAPEAVAPSNAGVIVGRVLGPDGRPMQDLSLITNNPETGTKTGGDGRYVLPQVAPGQVWVRFRGPAVLDSVLVTVRTGDTTRLDHTVSFLGQGG